MKAQVLAEKLVGKWLTLDDIKLSKEALNHGLAVEQVYKGKNKDNPTEVCKEAALFLKSLEEEEL